MKLNPLKYRAWVPGLALFASCTGHHSTRRMIPYSDLTSTVVAPADTRIAYGAEPLQFGELRLPAGTESAPLVVLIHGGCWRAQYDLQHVAGAAAAMASDGFAVWAIEYRRIGDPGGGWPGTFDDVARAVDHVRRLRASHPRLDTNRVVFMGHSAGGQLALWAASRKQNETTGLLRSAFAPFRPMGVVSLAGITDLAEFGASAGGCNQSVTPLLGGTPEQVLDRYHAVSPKDRVPIGATLRLVHGEADPIVPVAQSRNFLRVAKDAGDTVELDVVAGAGHFDVVAPQAEAWKSVMRALHAIVDPPARPVRLHVGG